MGQCMQNKQFDFGDCFHSKGNKTKASPTQRNCSGRVSTRRQVEEDIVDLPVSVEQFISIRKQTLRYSNIVEVKHTQPGASRIEQGDKFSTIDLPPCQYAIRSWIQMEQSEGERLILTTEQFRSKLDNVKLICEQPALYYHFREQIGKGGMCQVYKVIERASEKQYAVRIISIDSETKLHKIRAEIAVMQICQSKNIIQYHCTYLFKDALFMFVEYMDYGGLNRFILRQRERINEGVIAYILKNILIGLESIHSRRQLHRDLKSDNILINRRGDIKISDFGLALQFTSQKMFSQETVGTPAWMAPELIKKEQYTEKVDIWSLGIVAVELSEGRSKYFKMNPYTAMYMIASQPPETVVNRSSQFTTFVRACLQKQASMRPSVEQLLNNQFITQVWGQKYRGQFQSMLG